MALGGALVKNVFVRIRSDGAATAKADLADIAARAKQIGAMDPTIKVSVDDKAAIASLAALRLELAGLKGAGDQAGLLSLAQRLKGIGAAADSPRAKMSALRVEMDALKSAARLAGGAIGGGGPGAAAGGGGLLASLASLAPSAGLAGGGLAVLATGIGGIVPALAAATMGLGSFAAFAYPTFAGITRGWNTVTTAVNAYQVASAHLNIAIHRSAADLAAYRATIHGIEPDLRAAASLLTNQHVLWSNLSPAMQKNVTALANNKAELRLLLPDQQAALTALLAQRDAWNSLPPAQRKLTGGLQSLQTEFQKMVAAVAPLTFKVFNDGIKIANTLLPAMLPFAQAAGKALDGLLQGFAKFAASPAFKQWQSQMLALTGPTITTLGTGLAQITIAVGKLLIALSNPDALRAFKYALLAVADTIQVLAWLIAHATTHIVEILHHTAEAFDWLRHQVAYDGHQIAHEFDTVRHAVADMAHNIASYFDEARANIARWAADVGHWVTVAAQWFEQLPGKILGFLARLPGMLFSAGQHAMSSLISGFTSMIGSLGGAISGIASKVAGFFGLSPAKEGPLSGGGAPEIRGQHFGRDLARGIESQVGAVHAAASKLAAAAGTDGGTGYGTAGASPQIIFEVHPGGSGLDQMFMTWFANGVRARGGSAQIITRKPKFA